jgi:hypothetical protein
VLRLLASAAATAALLLVAACVLLLCLNLQGYIPPHRGWLYSRGLAVLSAPGGWLSKDSGAILSQVRGTIYQLCLCVQKVFVTVIGIFECN